MIILAFDALDFYSVGRYKCKAIKQMEYGQVDVSEFKLLRTVILWASFLTGKKMEEEIPMDKDRQWKFTLDPERTFLPHYDTYNTIDVPAFSLKQENHQKERQLMRQYFEDEGTVEEFDDLVWKHHNENKNDFFKAIYNYNLVMGYFDLADAIGHLSFGIPKKMKEVYKELDSLAKEVQSPLYDHMLIISDHGMKLLGNTIYGDHSDYGFYSSNKVLSLNQPKITDFFDIILKELGCGVKA